MSKLLANFELIKKNSSFPFFTLCCFLQRRQCSIFSFSNRFVRQKALTFREARGGMSDDLLKWRRNLFFNMTLPDISPLYAQGGSFVRSTGLLCALLQIRELELPPISYYIARIGLDLNLPGEWPFVANV